MHWLQQQLELLPTPDTIVHLGAGLCQELEHWRASGAERIVLVEPNPELLPELKRRAGEDTAVEIVPVAIAAGAGREALRLFNFPMLSSLREPSGLHQILPGLSQIGRTMVETRTIEQLLAELGLPAEGEHWLVIDTPGEEAIILDQLEQAERLHDFNRIFLTAGIEPLYQNAQSAASLTQRLQQQGFYVAGRPDASDGDWPRHHLALNRLALENRQLRHALEKATRRAEKLAAKRDKLKAANKEQAQWLAEAKKAHQAELTSLKHQLSEERQARQNELEQKLANAAKMEENLKAQRQDAESLKKRLQKQNEEAHKLKIKVSHLEEENDDYKERHKLLEEELIKAEAQIELIKQLFLSDDEKLDWDDEPEKA